MESAPTSVVKTPTRPPRISCWSGIPSLSYRPQQLRRACRCTRGSRAARRSRRAHASDRQILQLEPLVQPVLRALAAHARLLHPAEGSNLGGDEAGVDPDDARTRAPPTRATSARSTARRSTPPARTACCSATPTRPPPRLRSERFRATGPNVSSKSSPSSPTTPVSTVGWKNVAPRWRLPPSTARRRASTASFTCWRSTFGDRSARRSAARHRLPASKPSATFSAAAALGRSGRRTRRRHRPGRGCGSR